MLIYPCMQKQTLSRCRQTGLPSLFNYTFLCPQESDAAASKGPQPQALVWDLDTTLPFPCEGTQYAKEALQATTLLLPPDFASKRLIMSQQPPHSQIANIDYLFNIGLWYLVKLELLALGALRANCVTHAARTTTHRMCKLQIVSLALQRRQVRKGCAKGEPCHLCNKNFNCAEDVRRAKCVMYDTRARTARRMC
eukprot:739672-Pelagomonas_calceolata.AAC.4